MAVVSTHKGLSLLIVITFLSSWQLIEHGPAKVKQTNTSTTNELPALMIEDPLILEGWSHLGRLDTPIGLWDGRQITGADLAQFIQVNQIPVVWGSAEICNGSSCSLLHCQSGGDCIYEDGAPGVDKIYLNIGIQDQRMGQVARLSGELAHEAFHRMQLFGQKPVTLFEEYWAFYIGAQISGSAWPDFYGFDSLDEKQLKGWFTQHALRGYLTLQPYPSEFEPTSHQFEPSHSSYPRGPKTVPRR